MCGVVRPTYIPPNINMKFFNHKEHQVVSQRTLSVELTRPAWYLL